MAGLNRSLLPLLVDFLPIPCPAPAPDPDEEDLRTREALIDQLERCARQTPEGRRRSGRRGG